jgi:glycosyltransferase involved in cell wall biosynthesis
MPRTLTAIVLTLNEEKHIERCLRSLGGLAASIVVVDCGSTDRTRAIAGDLGARVLANPWTNYATQFNWALDHGDIATDWCLRIDADEHLSEPLRASLAAFLAEPRPDAGVTGLAVKRTVYFLGRPLRWGAMGGLYMLRLFRTDSGRCEDRWMDEHITLRAGRSVRVAGELCDENLNNIGWWVAKHNGYATREAIDLLQGREQRAAGAPAAAAAGLHVQARLKRFIKQRLYARITPGVRASLYFCYRYFARLGVLDGRAGLAFCVMQALWYRMLVDIKVLEIEARMRAAGKSLQQAVFEEYGVRLDAPRDGGSCR